MGINFGMHNPKAHFCPLSAKHLLLIVGARINYTPGAAAIA
jgi:hypothetical protein